MSILITSVLNCASDSLAISSSLSSMFGAFICSFFWMFFFFLSQCDCYLVRGGTLGIHQGEATHIAEVWCCLWGRGPEGNNVACWVNGGFHSLPPLPTSKLGPSCADSQVGGFVYILGPCKTLQQTPLWGWEFLSSPQTLLEFYSQRFWCFIPLHWNPELHGLSCFPVVSPILCTHKCEIIRSASHHLTNPGTPAATLPQILSAPAACLCPSCWSGCFFFNCLVVGLPYSLIFWQFWLCFVFKFVVFLLLIVRGGTVYLPILAGSPCVLCSLWVWLNVCQSCLSFQRTSSWIHWSFVSF